MAKVLEALSRHAIDVSAVTQYIACVGCETDTALDTFELAIWQSYASSLGATLDGTLDVWDMTPAQLVEATKCWPCANPLQLRAAYIDLLCEIFAAEAPQT